MIMFHNRETQVHDLSADGAYRAYLISRSQTPIAHYSNGMRWKRFCVAIRRVRNDIRSCFASIRMALVADKMQRARHELARVGMRHVETPAQQDRRRVS